jgi:hypothetical protein
MIDEIFHEIHFAYADVMERDGIVGTAGNTLKNKREVNR